MQQLFGRRKINRWLHVHVLLFATAAICWTEVLSSSTIQKGVIARGFLEPPDIGVAFASSFRRRLHQPTSHKKWMAGFCASVAFPQGVGISAESKLQTFSSRTRANLQRLRGFSLLLNPDAAATEQQLDQL